MATFRFRLTTLLKLREAERDERRRQLAEGLRAAETLQERINETQAELDGLRGIYGDAAKPGPVVLDRLLDAQRYESVVRAQLNVFKDQSIRVAEEVQRRRQILIEADRDVRILEKLRDKQQQRHNDELAHDEMKELDELAGRIRREAAQA